jgi:hypothetical protein
MADNDLQTQNFQLRYDETTAKYATQAVLNVTDDDVIINFASGLITENNNKQGILPIHTRIAMSHNNALRLAMLLNQALFQKKAPPSSATAKLPEIEIP